LSEALKLLAEREKDEELFKKVDKILGDHTPEILKNKQQYAVLFRQISTPNNETRRFIGLAKENNLRPLFFEYFDDKFTSNNEYKHSLAQLRVKDHENENSGAEKVTIVDFAKYDGKKLKDVVTLWDQPLTDFHKKLFTLYGYNLRDCDFYDASNWLKTHGEKPINYYTNFFILLTCYGILFENFLLHDTEGEFSRNIVLPAIEKAMNLTGLKPLIVPMEPIDMEVDEHWISYDKKVKSLIPKK
jgi:hypothetical protein